MSPHPLKGKTHPSEEKQWGRAPTKKTGRGQVVRVHHVLPPIRHLLATQYKRGDGTGWLHFEGREKDQWAVPEKMGLPNRNSAQIQASLESLVNKAVEESPHDHGKVTLLWIEVEPAKVVWAGTGGYWREVSVNDVGVIPSGEEAHA